MKSGILTIFHQEGYSQGSLAMFYTRVVSAAVAAFYGCVAAADCPLSIAVLDTADHVAYITVTNTGSEPVTVFTGNTVLSEHQTRDVIVHDGSGDDLPFGGIYVNYRRTGLSASMFRTFQPGETVTRPVDVSGIYDLTGILTANVAAVQSFRYIVGDDAPTALAEMLSCPPTISNFRAITPNLRKLASRHVEARTRRASGIEIQKRDVAFSSCPSSNITALKNSVGHAISMATAAKTAAGSETDYWLTWFKNAGQQTNTETIYGSIANIQTSGVTISCDQSQCPEDVYAYASPSTKTIVPCSYYWDSPELASNCAGDDSDRAGTMLHEMSHIFGTYDYAYGRDACLQLNATSAANNADTYEMYADGVRLGGCKRRA
ncbi:hypothetical protein BGW36DRAFT_421045 [Talaromyces proteolyticus]|uniref:deuterolysin n=1 Tax=Talaromyces proteolyticus TaxID=1131652 RepID=A0AAD4KEH9_9EURO|nr:uncharacterized protein BGW36DRAFT_421045 [Talaromyces proteolyticus]KAH8689145.1 hypothetical protein BGW36DRAFT_421045 [Talaromyces proteolyticus]